MLRQSASLHARPSARTEWFAQWCAGGAFGIALLAAAGWLFHALALAGQWRQYAPMGSSTAPAVLLLSSGVFSKARWGARRWGRYLALAAAVLPFLLALLVLTPAMFGQLPLGRMSPSTAGALILESAALMLLLRATRWRFAASCASLLAFVGAAGSLVVSLGRAYGAPLLYGGGTIPVAVPTALALVLVGAGEIILALPGTPALRAWTGESTRGMLLRAFLPGVLALVLLEGWLDTVSGASGGLNPALAHFLTVIVACVSIVALTAWTARHIGDALERAKEALETTERHSRAILDAAPVMIAVKTKDDRFERVNSAFADFVGLPAEEIVGRTTFDIVKEREVAQQGRDRDLEVIRTGKSVWNQLVKWSGSHSRKAIWALYSKVPFREPDGSIRGTLSYIVDVDERVRAEEALRESEARFRRMFQHSAAGMALVSPDYRFLQVNDALCKMLGYTESELLGQTFQDVTLPEDWQAGADLTRRVLSGETEMFHLEKRYLRKDGTAVWGLVSSTLIRDAQNKPLHFVTQILDITERKRAEEALRESESRYRELFESSSDAVFLVDTETCQIMEANHMATVLYGYDRDELLTKTSTELSAEPEDTRRRIQEAREEPGRVFRIPLRLHRKKDGTVFPIDITARCFVRQGQVLLLMCARDITESKRAEAALREGAERHRTILQTAMDGLWLTDTEGRLLEVNEAYCRMSGYSAPELLAMSISDLEANETASDTAAHVQKIMTRGEARFESRHRRKDGSIFEVEISVQYRATEGGWIVSFLRDITDRKRAEETLRNNEIRLRAILDATPFPIAMVDVQDDNVEFWSRSALKLFGHTAPSAVEWYQIAYPDPDYRRALIERWTTALETVRESAQAVNTGVYRVTCQDGSVRICELYAAFLADKLIVTFNDITDRQRAEEERELLQDQLAQAQKMESVGRLAGGVAHDFNNLLTVINGYAAFLSNQLAVRDPLRGYALEIGNAGERAASLTSQLLAFGRKQHIRPRAIDVNGIVADAERMLRRLIREDIELVTRLTPQVGLAMADPDQIHQVIMNLAVNARDAMPNGGQLEIATADVEVDEAAAAGQLDAAPGRYVRLTVADTGTGMTEEVRKNVFEPFFTTKELGKGTGLGLATVYGIVRQSDGWIEVESEPGRGSAFRIYLPRLDGGVAAEEAKPAAANASHGNETVLIVEDQRAVRGLAKAILERHGYHVLEAANGAEAQAAFTRHGGRIDLLLTDVVMPGMDGRALSEQLRELRPDLRVILMSGYAEDVIAHRGAPASGSAYIQKPFIPDELAAKVREVLDAPVGSGLES